MTLTSPIWLLLALPIAATLWLWPMPTRWLAGLRIAIAVLVIAALAGLAILLPSRSGVIVIVADRSRSMPDDAMRSVEETIALVHAELDADSRIAVVSFGQTAAVDQTPQQGKFGEFVTQVGADASDLHAGLDRALSLIDPDSPGRIVLLSDGKWTGRDPIAAAALAASRGVAIDYRLLDRPAGDDLAIADIEAPDTARPREAFMLTAWVRSRNPQPVRYELRRGDTIIAAGSRTLDAGLTRLTFRDSIDEPSTAAYHLRIDSDLPDPVSQNNTARALVDITGPRPIMLLTAKPDSGLNRLLSAGGLNVRPVHPDNAAWSLADLSNFSALIVDEVPANQIGDSGMQLVADWVRSTGSGLMMIGGKTSYGPGGYFKSPLDPVLPVSMELRREHRKHSLAIVIALDRSGSMAMGTPSGKSKMDLANIASAQVVDLLSPMDQIGVLAIDSVSHVISPMQHVEDPGSIKSRILRINSEGGGIFVYEALRHAVGILESTEAGARHIILFSDAADSEEPGAYQQLLAHCAEVGITCSVIGLGTEHDSDAGLLKDVAARGGGRIYFTDRADELPRLFAQDTFVVARSSFVDEQTPFKTTAALRTLLGQSLPDPPDVGGYNLTYLREGATLSAVTQDEYAAPVVASWQAGAGRVLAYTPQADGKYTGPIAQWDRVGDYYTSLARWTAGDVRQLDDGSLLTQSVREGVHTVTLHLDPDRANRSLSGAPTLTILRAVPGEKPVTEHAQMRYVDPNTLSVDLPLVGNETALATVELPGRPPIPMGPVTLPYSPEFKPQGPGRGAPALQRLARATGGVDRAVNLTDIWSDLPPRPRRVPLAPWLFLVAAVLLLVEVFERRTGSLSTALTFKRRPKVRVSVEPDSAEPLVTSAATAKRRTAARTAPSAPPPTVAPSSPAPAVASEPPPAPAPARASEPQPSGGGGGGVLDALSAARKKAKDRTDRK